MLAVFGLLFACTPENNTGDGGGDDHGDANGDGNPQAVQSITLDKESLELSIGESVSLSATIEPSTAKDEVEWSSSESDVATVRDGLVEAVSVGTTIITAKAGDRSASCTVTVKAPPVSSITLNKESVELYIGSLGGESILLNATIDPPTATDEIEWSSSESGVATVSDGVVEAVSPGTAIITAKAGDKSATCTVTVVPKPVTSITLDRNFISDYVGFNTPLTATVLPGDAFDKTVSWTTSDASIATFSNGWVTAKTVGTAIITASAGEATAQCEVKVLPYGAVDLGIVMTREDGSKYELYWAYGNLSESGLSFNNENFGDYYAWGETAPKENYVWSNYQFSNSINGPFSKYNIYSSLGTVDNKTVLDPEDDVAHVKLGGNWRIPTRAEWEELITQCRWVPVSRQNGVKGMYAYGPNGNDIFLPEAGYWSGTTHHKDGGGVYWSSTLCTDRLATPTADHSWRMVFDTEDRQESVRSGGRNQGCSVRPVWEQ